MSELANRILGIISLVLGFSFQVIQLCSDYHVWTTYPTISVTYSVHPYFLYGAFALQTVLQCWWLLKPSPRIQLRDGNEELDIESAAEKYLEVEEAASSSFVDRLLCFTGRDSYLAVYIFSSVVNVLWVFAFQCDLYIPALLALSFSAALQIYGLLGHPSSSSSPRDNLTIFVAKMNAAYTVMLIAKTWGALDTSPIPENLRLINHALIYVLLAIASGPDPTFGVALVYILASLYHGSYLNLMWHNTFYWTAAIITAIVILDFAIHHFKESEEGQSSDTVNTIYHLPTYFAGVMELPFPIPCEMEAPKSDVRYTITPTRIPRFMQKEQELIMPDYLSYAF